MAVTLEGALTRFLTSCSYVLAVRDLITKWRVELRGGYCLDIYFNATAGKYSYTLSQGNRRILGWDNAPHHPDLPYFPHHFHQADGSIAPSDLNGDPEHDLETVRLEVERYLAG